MTEPVIRTQGGRNTLAVFLDFENLAIGARDAGEPFDVEVVLDRLRESGKLVLERAYADWSRYRSYKQALHGAGFELIEVPRRSMAGKNSADIRLVVDAMDLSHAKPHIQTFVIGSGDSDFSPLVGKLRENGKVVVGFGLRDSTSDLLASSCDAFLFYEDLLSEARDAPPLAAAPPERREALELLVQSVKALERDGKDVLWASLVKETMARKRPSFNEARYGYRSFSGLLEEARSMGLVDLRRDDRSGTWVVARAA